jgi:hypothetical protein
MFLYLIPNNTVPDFPPPGGGLNTVTRAVPGEAMSDAGMSTMSWVLLTHRVVRSDPFHSTVAPWMNWEPFNVNRKLGPFEFTCDGFVDFARGSGLGPSEG